MGTAASHDVADARPNGPAEAQKSGDWLSFMPDMPQDFVGSWGPNSSEVSSQLTAPGHDEPGIHEQRDLAGMPLPEIDGKVRGECTATTAVLQVRYSAVPLL